MYQDIAELNLENKSQGKTRHKRQRTHKIKHEVTKQTKKNKQNRETQKSFK